MILGRDIKLPDDSAEEEGVSDSWKKRHRYVCSLYISMQGRSSENMVSWIFGHYKRRQEESGKVEDRNYRE